MPLYIMGFKKKLGYNFELCSQNLRSWAEQLYDIGEDMKTHHSDHLNWKTKKGGLLRVRVKWMPEDPLHDEKLKATWELLCIHFLLSEKEKQLIFQYLIETHKFPPDPYYHYKKMVSTKHSYPSKEVEWMSKKLTFDQIHEILVKTQGLDCVCFEKISDELRWYMPNKNFLSQINTYKNNKFLARRFSFNAGVYCYVPSSLLEFIDNCYSDDKFIDYMIYKWYTDKFSNNFIVTTNLTKKVENAMRICMKSLSDLKNSEQNLVHLLLESNLNYRT